MEKAYVEFPTNVSIVRVQSTSEASAVAPLAASMHTANLLMVSNFLLYEVKASFGINLKERENLYAKKAMKIFKTAAIRFVTKIPNNSISIKPAARIPAAAPKVLTAYNKPTFQLNVCLGLRRKKSVSKGRVAPMNVVGINNNMNASIVLID